MFDTYVPSVVSSSSLRSSLKPEYEIFKRNEHRRYDKDVLKIISSRHMIKTYFNNFGMLVETRTQKG